MMSQMGLNCLSSFLTEDEFAKRLQYITYNYDNMPSSINGTTFVYDYSGQRVKKGSTVYIGKLYECTGGTCTIYVFADDKRIAIKTGSNVYYYHTYKLV